MAKNFCFQFLVMGDISYNINKVAWCAPIAARHFIAFMKDSLSHYNEDITTDLNVHRLNYFKILFNKLTSWLNWINFHPTTNNEDGDYLRVLRVNLQRVQRIKERKEKIDERINGGRKWTFGWLQGVIKHLSAKFCKHRHSTVVSGTSWLLHSWLCSKIFILFLWNILIFYQGKNFDWRLSLAQPSSP